MSSITQALADTFHEAIEQSAHRVIQDPNDWQTFQETQQVYDQKADDCRQHFDEQFDDLVSEEAIRLAQLGQSFEIKGPDGAPAGETLEQRAQRNVVNAHQAELNQIQQARTNALLSVLENARTQEADGLVLHHGKAHEAFNEVSDRRKAPDRRRPSR